jgi:hypothetical protein
MLRDILKHGFQSDARPELYYLETVDIQRAEALLRELEK